MTALPSLKILLRFRPENGFGAVYFFTSFLLFIRQ